YAVIRHRQEIDLTDSAPLTLSEDLDDIDEDGFFRDNAEDGIDEFLAKHRGEDGPSQPVTALPYTDRGENDPRNVAHPYGEEMIEPLADADADRRDDINTYVARAAALVEGPCVTSGRGFHATSRPEGKPGRWGGDEATHSTVHFYRKVADGTEKHVAVDYSTGIARSEDYGGAEVLASVAEDAH